MRKDKVTAVVVDMPKRVTETIWTKPARFVDERWLHDRILNTNQHKIRYEEAHGQKFRGRTKTCPGIFAFDCDVKLGVKIEKVETIDYTFHGVIPTEHTDKGTVCTVDYYE